MNVMPRRPTKPEVHGGAMLTGLVLGVPVAILRAWALQHLWAWFVLPTFGVTVPSIATLYGLAWVVGLLWPMPKTDDEPMDGQAVFKFVFVSVWMSLFGLLVGAIAHAVGG